MITAIKTSNFSNNRSYGVTRQSNLKRVQTLPQNNMDSVSFSGKTQVTTKLTDTSTAMVQDFAQKLKLNKIYKFENPVENYQITTFMTDKKNPERSLLVKYSGFSDNNTGKHIMFTVQHNGEVLENGEVVKNAKELNLYEKMLPELINAASKELKL